jgi:hypothetical protein
MQPAPAARRLLSKLLFPPAQVAKQVVRVLAWHRLDETAWAGRPLPYCPRSIVILSDLMQIDVATGECLAQPDLSNFPIISMIPDARRRSKRAIKCAHSYVTNGKNY